MNEEKSKRLIKKYFRFKKNTINLFKKQIDDFYKIKNNYGSINNEFNINDNILLSNNVLIHGTRIDVDKLDEISEIGLIAPEFLGKYNKNKKKPFVVEFWKIEEEITLKEYINKYCGVTIEVKSNTGDILNKIITPLCNIEKEILSLKNYRDYVIYQNQEQRFLPNNYNNNSTMAFIIRMNDKNETLLKNDIFSSDFNQKILKQIVPKWFYNKYMVNRNFDNYETGREKAIIYGVPACLIEGILVNREIENDQIQLAKIKKNFPKCYVCNIDGKVIA